MSHAGTRTVGLDGVVAQQDDSRKSGFEFAYNNIRYGGAATRSRARLGWCRCRKCRSRRS